MFRYKLYIPNIILITICLVVLITIYLFNKVSSDVANDPLMQLQARDSAIHHLQSSKDHLYMAQNAYDFYTTTHDSEYKQLFIDHLKHFEVDLELSRVLDDSSSNNLETSLQQKIYLATAIVRLKQFADSLLISSIHDSVFSESTYVNLNSTLKSPVKKYHVYQRDTIKYVPVKEKKTLFKKIASIFKDDEDSLKAVTSGGIKVVAEENTFGSNGSKTPVDASNRKVRQHYLTILRKELDIRKKIDERNQQTALYNQAIFAEVQHEITKVLEEVSNSRKTVAYTTINNLHKDYFNQNEIFIISFTIISILILMLAYKVVVTRRYEKNILSDKQQALALSEMKASFLNTMSHEIRTPLTAIIGFADHIHSNGVDKNTGEYIQHIKYASDHLLETVNDVLAFSKLESGKVKITNEPFEVHQVLEGAVNTYKLQAQKKKLHLTLRSSVEPSLVVLGDAFHLRQILYNLINNAIKFTEKGGITVTASSRMLRDKIAELTFAVEDTGRGIDQEAVDKVFKEFVQIKEKEDNVDHTPGTGLGLSITQKLTTLLGGTISLTSQVGQGSTFTVIIPFAVSDAIPKKETLKEENAYSSKLIGKKVLLAEDSEPIIFLAKTILKDLKMEVSVAKDGEEAWELFNSREPFDYILTDIEMPKLNGHELARRIRKTDTGIRIIAMTAHTPGDEYEEYKKEGIDAIITKPFKKAELDRVLSQLS